MPFVLYRDGFGYEVVNGARREVEKFHRATLEREREPNTVFNEV
jgi:hypothetical protein